MALQPQLEEGSLKPEPAPASSKMSHHARTEEEEWHISAPGSVRARRRYQFCGDCDYKVVDRKILETHVKLFHPSSMTALPPPPKKGRAPPKLIRCSFDHCSFQTMEKFKLAKHEMNHLKKSTHKCFICSYSTTTVKSLGNHVKRDHPEQNGLERSSNNQVDSVVLEGEPDEVPVQKPEEYNISQDSIPCDRSRKEPKEEFCNTLSGHRKRYQFCGDCDYKNVSRAYLIAHVKRNHPSSKTALPPPPKKGAAPSIRLRCSHHCDYQTTNKLKMEEHENRHKRKSTYQCLFCSYSVAIAKFLRFHLKRDHPASTVGQIPSVGELSVAATKEKFYIYGPNNIRRKYLHCGDCDFQTYKRSTLVTHVKTLHPTSTTALPPLMRKKIAPGALQCAHCNHRAASLESLNHHQRLHRDKSEHTCPFCSYSVSNLSHLNYHMNHDHVQASNNDLKEETSVNMDGVPAAILETGNTSASAPTDKPNDIRNLYRCSLCHFEINRKDLFQKHVKLHQTKYNHQCPCCSFSCRNLKYLGVHLKRDHSEEEREKMTRNQEDGSALPHVSDRDGETSSAERSKEGDSCYYYSTGNIKKIYNFCGDCGYKTCKRSTLIAHANLLHPSSTTAVPPPRNQRKPFCCPDCQFRSTKVPQFQQHRKLHRKRYPFQCPLCSFSITNAKYLRRHLKLHHLKSERNKLHLNEEFSSDEANSDSSSEEEVDKENNGFHTEDEEVCAKFEINWTERFGLRDCYVKLYDISFVVKEIKLERSDEDLGSMNSEEVVQSRETQVNENQGKIEIEKTIIEMITRVEFMEEKVRNAKEEMHNIKLKKDDCWNKIKKTIGRKVKAKLDLKRFFLEARKAKANKTSVESVKQMIKKLKMDVQEMEKELKTLRSEETLLDEDLADAEESHSGIMQVVNALQLELKELQSK